MRNHSTGVAGSSHPIIEVRGLTKRFSGPEGEITAVDGVSFDINEGEIVGFLGPNGAGKTTTIKSILGIIEPTDGTALIDGLDPTVETKQVYNRVSGMLEGARNLYWRLTVRENLRYFTGLQGRHPDRETERHERLLSLVNLESKADEQVRSLSRGMKQKACLACVLARSTPIVFLDEPTLGLDVEGSRDLQSELRRLATEEDRTVIISSHDMDVIESVCDRVLLFDDGELAVEDRLESLLGAFSTQAYRVHLSERFPAEQSLEGYDPDWAGDRRSFSVTLRDETDFYNFTDVLEASDASLDRIEPITADLENVFVSILEEEADVQRQETPATDGQSGFVTGQQGVDS
ncbi:ABC transporter ATP-binding protein [Haloarcula sp. S1CR25-12]|uniref:ABC transporter ATP-binding protein n=1 Tax=Haloarcula saliterrae TaxID=2950534 RepID=A0ABU2FDP8_9EURY|nr:ABC transporter ATP-binding protein [Haloarcula sp. S1CR25-12]MDS0260073.1 ABC transporter ATP-binding protein [Haloarcula sp. S1CR25-12]